MARGNRIIVSPEPKGRFDDIIVSGTPKPGTIMELKVGTAAINGNVFTYEPAGTTANFGASEGMSADGDRLPIAVLLCFADHAACPPGKTATDAYADGDRGAIYWPLPGEEVNVLFANVTGTGTADETKIGTKLIVDDGTGKLVVSVGTVESEPFVAMEAKTDVTADVLVWAKATGQ